MARINPRQVEAFRAMMLTGSVTEAAKLMAVTQPAVSRLLRDFQALLKMELFERRGSGLVPSTAATALYMEVERSFVGLERITAAAEEIRSRRTGTLRIAALPALSNGFLPRLTGHFLKERPNFNLAFFGVISPIVIDWVLNNQCDIGFAEAPIAHSGLPCVRMPALPRVAILPAGHRLASKATLEPGDFEDETFISLSAGSTGRHLIDQAFSRHDVRRILRVETMLSEIMCGLVSSGLGVALCDPFTAREFESRGVVARRFLPRIDFEFAAVFPPQRRPSPVALELVETLRQALVALDEETAGPEHHAERRSADHLIMKSS
ncbi:LysR substrate-binding domain-containing protein [Bradyrhizobium sp. 26S5]|uniref:LysR substrate-binding domain-containing protein n=1 Tax=unclassified Bradyrhizobium TaxID=2631580 RepID=UPI0014097249|nr:LysR substrate-binding domain-containing protein [Bradyrhizobium sp. 2S1]MCK7665865.1 LysR substrate-binding domain-containing protein [Bradyrhizobium sp. 2S1]